MIQSSYGQEIQKIIGDYQSFFRDLLDRLNSRGIDIIGKPISHICYRIDPSKYEEKRDELKKVSSSYAEHEFGGRMVAEFKLREPLDLGNGFSTSMIELLPHKPGRSYGEGLENFGVVIGEELKKFVEKHGITDVKHRPSRDILFVTFDNSKTVKFYEQSLQEIVEADGFAFTPAD